MFAILGGFFNKHLLVIAGIISAIIAVGAIILGARSAGKNAERVYQLRKKQENMERANEVRQEVERLPDSDVTNELFNEWKR